MSKLSNVPYTYPYIREIIDGNVGGRLEFTGWVADQWTLPVYPRVFGELKGKVKGRRGID